MSAVSFKGIFTILLFTIAVFVIFSSVSCKKEAELNVKTDTTTVSLENRNAINKLELLISVVDFNQETKNYDLISAELNITCGTNNYSAHLEQGVNIIPLRESILDFNIEVSKEGYNKFSTVMQQNELMNWVNKPFIVVLASN